MEKVYLIKLDTTLDDNFLLGALPSKIVNHCKQYKESHSFQLSLQAWYNLVLCFKEDFNFDLNDFNLNLESDKPYIYDNSFYFSISHSHNLIALIISDRECGIDIELEFDKPNLSKKILSKEELLEYTTTDTKKEYLNYKWVTKEAYSKFIATGITNKILNSKVKTTNLKTYSDRNDTYYIAWFVKE